jgi:hypothetical protein
MESPSLEKPPDRERLGRAIVGDEDAIVRGRALEEDLVSCPLGIKVDGPHDVPASVPQGSDEVIVDACVGEDGETPGHYRVVFRLRYSALARS